MVEVNEVDVLVLKLLHGETVFGLELLVLLLVLNRVGGLLDGSLLQLLILVE